MKSPYTELLSPAGSPQALDAAIKGGCDAVYFGGKAFNARINAKNFSNDDVLRSVEKCHAKNVRAYVTFNTLALDRELPEALEYAYFLYKAGVDALIITDLGLASQIRKYLPDFELHASTQCSAHNSYAASFLAKHGFSRMVTSRESSKETLKTLVERSPVEIEAFVHGAMCVCQSGQCLMSSFIGGRSGNRGECAQPCRLPYNGSYPLSLKDMCLASHVTELSDMGIASLKIEGRMKSPEYVYSVTSVYRRLIDEHRNASSREIDRMAAVFSRDGFSDGYYTGKINNGMLGVRSEEGKKASSAVSVKQKDLGYIRRPLEKKERTNVLPAYRQARTGVKKYDKPLVTARFYEPSVISGELPFDIVYLPLDKFDPAKANGVFLPPVIYDREADRYASALKRAVERGAEHVLVGNIGHIEIAEKSGAVLHGDYRLNIFNTPFAKFFEDASEFDSLLLSPELTLPQIRDIPVRKGVVVYGKVPLMTLEKRVGTDRLTDRKRVSFPVMNEAGRDIVFNSVPLYMLDKKGALRDSGIYEYHFIFSNETPGEVKKIAEAWKDGLPAAFPIKRIK